MRNHRRIGYIGVCCALFISVLWCETLWAQKSQPVPQDGSIPHMLYRAGLQAIQFGDWEGGKDYFKKLARLEPQNPLIHYDLGIVLSHLGMKDESEQELKKALGLGLPQAQEEAARKLLLERDSIRTNGKVEPPTPSIQDTLSYLNKCVIIEGATRDDEQYRPGHFSYDSQTHQLWWSYWQPNRNSKLRYSDTADYPGEDRFWTANLNDLQPDNISVRHDEDLLFSQVAIVLQCLPEQGDCWRLHARYTRTEDSKSEQTTLRLFSEAPANTFQNHFQDSIDIIVGENREAAQRMARALSHLIRLYQSSPSVAIDDPFAK